MRIAFLADSYLYDGSNAVNGTQVQMFNLATAFRDRGQEVHYISMTDDRERIGALPEGITFHWIERKTSIFSWCFDVGDFRRILARVRPDALYQRGRSHLTWVAARWARENDRIFVWGSNGEDSCDFWKVCSRVRRSRRPLWRKTLLYPVGVVKDILIHRGVRHATRVVNQTAGQAASLRINYGKQGRLLPSYFRPPAAEAGRSKEKTVLWLANLSPVKQPELFLRLAERCRGLDGWTFLLAGPAPLRAYGDAIERIAARLPNVRRVGFVPFEKTHSYYERAALFVNTSRPEGDGLPNAFIQAWQSGTPVLSLHHDPNGWLAADGALGICTYGNRDGFVRAGRAFLERWDGRRRQECVRFAADAFSSDDTIDAYLDLFGSP